MKQLRLLLLPFSLIYLLVTAVRNFLYDTGLIKSCSFDVPVIAVGNLSTGGTGKTPQIEYLIRLLSDTYSVATLSRGYKRKSKGFVLADASSDANTLGDEPYQFYSKFPNINVAVDADRKNGITQLLSLAPKPEVILLDDAYQHRRVQAGFYILLTAYSDIYAEDFLLPAGNLRESRSGARRAEVIIVTKCPPTISDAEMAKVSKKLNPKSSQKVYFTCIEYDTAVFSEEGSLSVESLDTVPKTFVAGIAKPKPFFSYMQQQGDEALAYPDHHDFTAKEIEELKEKSKNRLIVTTEKDYVRLKGKLRSDKLYYLPIRSRFLNDGADFDQTILHYVGKSTGNS